MSAWAPPPLPTWWAAASGPAFIGRQGEFDALEDGAPLYLYYGEPGDPPPGSEPFGVLDKSAVIAGDFHIDPAGHLRFLVHAAPEAGARRIGRVVQRLAGRGTGGCDQ